MDLPGVLCSIDLSKGCLWTWSNYYCLCGGVGVEFVWVCVSYCCSLGENYGGGMSSIMDILL